MRFASLCAVILLCLGVLGASPELEKAWQTTNDAGDKAFAAGQYGDAEKLYLQASQIGTQIGVNDIRVANSLMFLARAYQSDDKYDLAEPACKRAIAIKAIWPGPEDPETAIVMCDLGSVYRGQGKLEEAAVVFRQALGIFENSPRPGYAGHKATCLLFLGSHAKEHGQFAQAEAMLKMAVEQTEKAEGSKNPLFANALSYLADLYQTQGKYTLAEPLYKRSADIMQAALDPNHPDLARGLTNLGSVYVRLGRYDEAQALYSRVLAVWEKRGDSPDLSDILSHIAELRSFQGNYADAAAQWKRAVAIADKTLGPEHPRLANELTCLGTAYTMLDRPADAEPCFRRALAIQEKLLGPNHPEVANALDQLAQVLGPNAQSEAAALQKRAQAIRERNKARMSD